MGVLRYPEQGKRTGIAVFEAVAAGLLAAALEAGVLAAVSGSLDAELGAWLVGTEAV